MYVYIYMSVTLSAPGGKHVFKMASYQLHGCHLCTSGVRRIRDQDKSMTSFCPGRLTTAPTRLEFVEPLFQQRSDSWSTGIDHERYEHEFQATLCVVYRDIRLLKADLCSRCFSSNCMGDAAPKHSIGCGFVLTNSRHTSARGPICAMRTSSKKVALYYML